MSNQSVEMLQTEVKKMINYDLSNLGDISEETATMALSVFSEREYKQIVQEEYTRISQKGIR